MAGRDMIHVVHVLDSLEVGGTENGVVNLVGALRQGFRHTVIGVTRGGPLEDRLPREVAVHQLGKRSGIDLGAIVRLAWLLRRLAPDVVHSRNWGAFDAVPAARLARVPALVHGEHGREASDPHGLDRRRNRLRHWMSPLVDRFVAVSADLQHWLVGTVGIPAHKVTTICNGVDLARFAAGDRRSARRALGIADDPIVVGTVGRLDPVKDHVGLLEAYAALGAQGPAHALVIVGDGPCHSALLARSRRADVAGRAHLLGERRDIPALLAGLDVFVLPSIAEGISNTILEAMAAGLPVVATRIGGNPELVQDGVTGTLVPVGDREALARALVAYLRAPELRARHGAAGRRRVTEEFGLDRMAAQYRTLYAGVRRPREA